MKSTGTLCFRRVPVCLSVIKCRVDPFLFAVQQEDTCLCINMNEGRILDRIQIADHLRGLVNDLLIRQVRRAAADLVLADADMRPVVQPAVCRRDIQSVRFLLKQREGIAPCLFRIIAVQRAAARQQLI